MERAVQVQRQPVRWDSLKKMIHFICKKTSDCMGPSQPAFTIPSQLGKYAIEVSQPDKGDDRMLQACTYLGKKKKKMAAVSMSQFK